MTKKQILSYLRTAIVTMLIMTALIVGVVIDTKNKAKIIPTQTTVEEYQKQQIIYLIDKYQYEARTTNSYILSMKLGLLYETIQEYEQAETEYRKAIAKAPYRVFEPIFMLSELYIKTGNPEKAAELIDNLKEYPDKKLIKQKANIYKMIADEYLQQEKYQKAILSYKNSLFYIRKIKVKDERSIIELKNNLSKAYIGLSNLYLKEGKYQRALNNALEGTEITETKLLINYIATISKDKNPQFALSYYDKLFKVDKNMINYEDYGDCIGKIIDISIKANDTYQEKIYREKLRMLDNFITRSIIKKSDVSINFTSYKYKKQKFNLGEDLSVTYTIVNNQLYPLNRLYMMVKVYSNGELKKEISNQVINKTNILQGGGRSTPHKMFLYIPYKEPFVTTSTIKIDVYLTKHNKIKPILVETVLIPKM